ncbi:MAG: D-alanyl-D-alanine carboxypeptidase [Promicromonosporaceae bacterium]|nr:D-alanyl-D-alanine carboxypeptidase [Promicromonosporaceae bacterium]
MGWRGRATAATLTFSVLIGGYLVLDAHDVVPGILTLAPPPPQPAPFPTALAATIGPEPVSVLPRLPEDAPVPDSGDVQIMVRALASEERLGERVGVIVIDALTGDVLGSAAPYSQFAPASTQKILTAVAVHNELDVESTLDTVAMLDRTNRVTLVGGGDMLLAAGAGDPAAINGRAGLGDLADQVAGRLREAGVTAILLSYEDSMFTGPTVAAAVPAVDVASGHIAPVASLAVNVAAKGDEPRGPRYPDPALNAAEVFASQLRQRGIRVSDRIEPSQPAEDAIEIGRVHSATLREISAWTQLRSDNTLTEVLGRLVAIEMGHPATGEDALNAVLESLESLGINTSAAALVDLSGLGRGSLISPRLLADITLATLNPEHPHLRDVFTDMPICGLSGTLALRCPNDNPALGVTRAKTGSLPGVRGLVGTVMTSDDRLLVFAINADEIPVASLFGATIMYDLFVGQLAAFDSPDWPPPPAEDDGEETGDD